MCDGVRRARAERYRPRRSGGRAWSHIIWIAALALAWLAGTGPTAEPGLGAPRALFAFYDLGVASAAPSTEAPTDAAGDAAWTPVGPGVHYAVLEWSNGQRRQDVHVLRVQRGNPHARLAASLARGQVDGAETVLAQALRLNAAGGDSPPGAPLADASAAGARVASSAAASVVGGVNADFFASSPIAGFPIGLHVQGGELVISPADRPVFGVLLDGRPVIGVPRLTGEVWREQPPADAAALAAGGGLDELLVRASINEVNRPVNGLGVAMYTPRFGAVTPAVGGVVVTLRGVVGPLRNGRVYSGVVARVEAGTTTPIRAAIPADGVVLVARGPAEILLEDLSPGEWLQFRVDLAPPFDQLVEAVAGWPILLENGQALPLDNGNNIVSGRHPRTAVGYNDEYVFMVVADGRQPGYADGMTLSELARFMADLGATDALNLDGGGSATMVLRPPGEERPVVANRPSDGSQRVVGNALFVVSTAPPGPLATLHVRPAAPAVLVGAAVPLQLLGQDVYHNPAPVDPARVTWSVSGPGGGVVARPLDGGSEGSASVQRTRGAGTDHLAATDAPFALLAREPGVVSITAHVGDVSATVPIDVVTSVAQLELVPDIVHLAAGESAALDVRAYDETERPVWVEPTQLTWSVGDASRDGASPPSAGRARLDVGEDGRITGLGAGDAVLHARFGAAAASAAVTVDRPPVLLSDFETPGQWFANVVRAQAALSIVGPEEPVRTGRHAVKLVYDLSVAPGGTAAAYVEATTPIPIPDRPRAIGVWVYGDASGHWLRANYFDGNGQRQVLDLTAVGGLDWTGWRFVQADVPADAVLPLTFERVYVVEINPDRQSRGVLYFDDLVALYGGP